LSTSKKIMSLREAIHECVADGSRVALEGFTHLIPFAAGHEIVRQKKHDLALVRMTPDLVYDQLIGMGCARELVFSWGGNPGVGSLHRLRDAVENGWPAPLALNERSHADMANAYVAGASRMPFAVLRAYEGSDYPKHNPGIASLTCPFTGERVTAVPAIRLDAAIIHAQQADRQGNVQLWGLTGVQKEAVLAAEKVVVTVEEIVDHLELQPGGVILPSWVVTAVAAVPGGAAPSYAQGYYDRDNAFYRAWDAIARDRATFRAWMDRFVLGTGTFDEYRRELARAADPAPRGPRASRGEPPAGRNVTADERMTVAASRLLRDGAVCFVGIGLPSKAANLARATHAPSLVMIYEAGAIGAKPTVLPLSIGDGELATTADAVVSTAEVFRYWLQGGHVDVGFLGAAQIDRYANINTTVIGPYEKAKVRLPGAGGAPEIASQAGEVFIVMPQSKRAFVERLDFVTSVGFSVGGDSRSKLGMRGRGPTAVITDFGILRPDPSTKELTLTELHPGATVEGAVAATGWPLRVSANLTATAEPTAAEIDALRKLERRSREAHGGQGTDGAS
jgi:acyl CoA:acetate/3-ketoacid CoA transferase beta subunit